MRKFPLIVLFLALGVSVSGQEATINSPVAQSSIAKVKLGVFSCDPVSLTCNYSFRYLDSGNNQIADAAITALGFVRSLTIPSAAGSPCTSATTINGMAGAMNVARSGETGANARIQQFRQLGYFFDQGCFSQAVTLAP